MEKPCQKNNPAKNKSGKESLTNTTTVFGYPLDREPAGRLIHETGKYTGDNDVYIHKDAGKCLLIKELISQVFIIVTQELYVWENLHSPAMPDEALFLPL